MDSVIVKLKGSWVHEATFSTIKFMIFKYGSGISDENLASKLRYTIHMKHISNFKGFL
jgi:hypothetical protein